MPAITLDMLRLKLACPEQVSLFERLFGDCVEPTLEQCIEHAGDFHWEWAATNLLSNREAFWVPVRASWVAFREKMDVAFLALNVALQGAQSGEYQAVKKTALDEYESTMRPFLKAHKEARAKAFYEAWIKS